MAHEHAAAAAHRGRLLAVLLIGIGILALEVVGAVLSNSLALLADAVMLDEGADPTTALDALCSCLSDDFDIEHSTFQLEAADRRRLEVRGHA